MKKIIITDTNIITDLGVADVLEDFVQLSNVYICDLVKKDEINAKTCNTTLISKIKTIESTIEELDETITLSNINKKLSLYDLLNYVVTRDNDGILATGDNKLKTYCENRGITVIRTLKIIKLMHKNNIITTKKAMTACLLLKNNNYTRIPEIYINNLLEELKKETVIQ